MVCDKFLEGLELTRPRHLRSAKPAEKSALSVRKGCFCCAGGDDAG